MSYEFYRVLHFSAIFFCLGSLGALCFMPAEARRKPMLIATAVFGFLILVAGMGLLARLEFKHDEPFPTWVRFKLGIWVCLAFTAPMVIRKLKARWFYALVLLAALAAWFGVYKPGA